MQPCRRCGATLVAGDQFCSTCGEPVAAVDPRCVECGTVVRPGATFCPSCGAALTPAAPSPSPARPGAPAGPGAPGAPPLVPASRPAPRSSALPWLLGVGALALIVIVASLIVIVTGRRSTTSTAGESPTEVFGTLATVAPTSAAPATTTTAAPTTTSPPTTPSTTEPPPSTAAPADPVATLKNSVVTTPDGLRIQLAGGDGAATATSDPTLRMTAAITLAQRGQRWPAIGIVDFGAGAGGTAQEIVVLDEAGQVRQSGVFADRGSVSAVVEEGDRVRANYLERFPEDAMMAPGSIAAHATYDPVSGRTELSPLTQPDVWCTADAGCMDTVGMSGFVSTEGFKVRGAPSVGAEVLYDDVGGAVFVAICVTHGEKVDGDDRWLIGTVPHSFAWAPLFRLDTRFAAGSPAGQAPPAPGGPAPEC